MNQSCGISMPSPSSTTKKSQQNLRRRDGLTHICSLIFNQGFNHLQKLIVGLDIDAQKVFNITWLIVVIWCVQTLNATETILLTILHVCFLERRFPLLQ